MIIFANGIIDVFKKNKFKLNINAFLGALKDIQLMVVMHVKECAKVVFQYHRVWKRKLLLAQIAIVIFLEKIVLKIIKKLQKYANIFGVVISVIKY